MMTNTVQAVTLAGKRFVIMPETEYARLTNEPALPKPNAEGHYPALESMRVLIARDIIRDRRRLGLTQVELARRAGIRPETLNRIERGERSPSVATVVKIDKALTKAEAEDRE
jgi:DNA-binding XRE family transcriptional regulator